MHSVYVMALTLLRVFGLLAQPSDITTNVTLLSLANSTASPLIQDPLPLQSTTILISTATPTTPITTMSNFVEFAADSKPAHPGDPSTCANLCPHYKVIEQRPGYEVRAYGPSFWLSTFILSDNRVLAELEGSSKLFDYLRGNNDRGQVMNITVPLLTQVKYRKNLGAKEPIDYTMSLYLSPTVGLDPPFPMTSEILIDSEDSRLVFVRRFHAKLWEMSDRHVRAQATQLMESLRDTGEAFLDKYIYLATYTRPQLYNETDYELWVFASKFRDPSRLRPRVKSVDPPLSRVTAKTRRRVCRGLECPRFDVLRVYKYGIQKRRYFDTKFASYSPNDCEFSRIGLWKGFMPLHLYKHGVNSHMEMLEPTRPIGILQVQENAFNSTIANCSHNFTVSLYLPERLHSNPPTTGPQGPKIRITVLDDLIVYVFSVGGYILEPDRIAREMARFTRRLRQFGVCFRPTEYYVVVYDFIVRFHGRLNEIWLVAKNCNSNEQ